jgi:hypothetical protein
VYLSVHICNKATKYCSIPKVKVQERKIWVLNVAALILPPYEKDLYLAFATAKE